jgi:hypothetical protein
LRDTSHRFVVEIEAQHASITEASLAVIHPRVYELAGFPEPPSGVAVPSIRLVDLMANEGQVWINVRFDGERALSALLNQGIAWLDDHVDLGRCATTVCGRYNVRFELAYLLMSSNRVGAERLLRKTEERLQKMRHAEPDEVLPLLRTYEFMMEMKGRVLEE